MSFLSERINFETPFDTIYIGDKAYMNVISGRVNYNIYDHRYDYSFGYDKEDGTSEVIEGRSYSLDFDLDEKWMRFS